MKYERNVKGTRRESKKRLKEGEEQAEINKERKR